MIGHISTDELARYRAGAIRAARAARIRVHLAGCARCAGVAAQLAGVSEVLSGIPLPVMPDSLTLRIQAVLAEEGTRRGAAMPAMSVTSPGPVTPAAPVTSRAPAPSGGRRRNWRPRVPDWSSPVLLRSLAATGAVALVVAGGVVVATLSTARPSTGAAARPASGPAPRPRSKSVIPGNAGGAAAVSGTMPVRYSYQGHTAVTNVVLSNFNYTKSNLAADVRDRIKDPLVAPATGQSPATGTVPSAMSNRPAGVSTRQLAGCLAKVAAGRRIVLAEVARYLALPATIVVLKPAGRAFDVIVVGSACSGGNADVITRLTLPRG